jgi:tetratricopeptide (TPR) repeat protein
MVTLLRWKVAGIPLGARGVGNAAYGASGHLGQLPEALIASLRLLSIPWPLSFYYTAEEIRGSLSMTVGALVTVLVFLLLAYLGHRRLCLQAAAWIVGFLAPALTFTSERSLIFERFLYLPSVGFCLLAGLALERLLGAPRFQKAVTAAIVLGLLACGAGTLARGRVWHDSRTFVGTMVKTSPPSSGLFAYAGELHLQARRPAEALAMLNTAIAMDPGNWTAYTQLGAAYYKMPGKAAMAIDPLLKAIALQPPGTEPYKILASVYVDAGLQQQAIDLLNRAAAIDHDDAFVFNNLSVLYQASNRLPEAVAMARRASALKPGYAVPHYNLGIIYLKQGRRQSAWEEFQVLNKLDPQLAARLRVEISAAEMAAKPGSPGGGKQ